MSQADLELAVLTAIGDQATLKYDGDAFWILFSGFLVFFMHAGFAMLEAGSVRAKNKVNILFKNIGTVTFGGLAYFLLGYGIAYGDASNNSFLGTSKFAGADFVQSADGGNDRRDFFFQYAFCVTAATITSGAVAGRIKLEGYFIVATVLTAFVYPVVSHWVWSSTGWLSAFKGDDVESYLFGDDYEYACGVFDYAGSGVVHLTGGVSAFWGAFILGPRLGRFGADKAVNYMPGHNLAMATLGTLILWFGWFGFNCGSALAFDGLNVSKVAITTALSPASACLTSIVLQKARTGKYDLPSALNSILAGLVGITAGCSTVSDWAAIPIGVVSCLIYTYSAELLIKYKIDDPIGASPVHGACGVWGVIAIGIFSTPEGLANAYSCPSVPPAGSGDWLDVLPGYQMAVQIILALSVIGWVTATMAPVFYLLLKTGLLRVDQSDETLGLDMSEHGGHAYEAKPEVVETKEDVVPAEEAKVAKEDVVPAEEAKVAKEEESVPAPAVKDVEEEEKHSV